MKLLGVAAGVLMLSLPTVALAQQTTTTSVGAQQQSQALAVNEGTTFNSETGDVPRQAPTAIAPSASVGVRTCAMTEDSSALSTPVGGWSDIDMGLDPGCNLARLLAMLREGATVNPMGAINAEVVLCQQEEMVRQGYELLGITCQDVGRMGLEVLAASGNVFAARLVENGSVNVRTSAELASSPGVSAPAGTVVASLQGPTQ